MGDLIGPNPTKVGGPKSEKSDDGKYENFCYRLTDRLTDGADYIGPKWVQKEQLENVYGRDHIKNYMGITIQEIIAREMTNPANGKRNYLL